MDRIFSSVRRNYIQVLLLVTAVLWAGIRVGPQFMDTALLTYARSWPAPGLGEGAIYFRSSPLGPVLTQGISVAGYMFVHVLAITVFLGLAFTWLFLVSPPALRLTGFRVFVLSPVVAVLLLHIGLYDAFTCVAIALVMLAWLSNSRWLILISAIPLGFQHFEQGIVLLIVWLLAFSSTRDQLSIPLRSLSFPWAAFPGLILGKVILSLALLQQGLSPFEGRSSVFLEWLTYSLRMNVGKTPFILWGSLLGLWVLLYFAWSSSAHTRNRMYLVSAVAVAFVFSFMTIDNIRVMTVVTIPLTLLLIVSWLVRRDTCPRQGDNATEALFWLIPPYVSFPIPADQWVSFIGEIRNFVRI